MSQKTALITGVTGQDGSYLAEFLLEKSYQVVGLVSQKYNIGFSNIDHIKSELELVDGDLLDEASLVGLVKKFKPDEIYNLAGLTFVPKSWKDPTLVLNVNTLGVSRLLSAIRDHSLKSKFYQATSAKIFGYPVEAPQTEDTPLNPVDPYSVSKAAAHQMTQSFRDHFNLFAVSGILYNHESERRGEEFVTRKISLTAARIKLKKADSLTLGSLEAKQDWGYAPDYVEAMWLMLQQDKPDDYIIATGKLSSVKDVCEIAFSHLGLNYQDYIKVDKKLFRKIEAKAPVGDASKAKRVLNWEPKVDLEKMITKMVDHDLQLVSKGKV